MQEQEIELSIGDSLQIGEHTMTIVDIEGDKVTFRVDHEEDFHQVSIEGRYETIPR